MNYYAASAWQPRESRPTLPIVVPRRRMMQVSFARYGDSTQVEYKDVATPSYEPDEVLVKVKAASLNRADWQLLTGEPWPLRLAIGVLAPKREGLGSDFAGTVVACGAEVHGLIRGDDVFGQVNGEEPGLPLLQMGAMAEYVAVRAKHLVRKPSMLSFSEVAALPMAGMTALSTLRTACELRGSEVDDLSGVEVLVIGGSGGVGTYSVQLAAHMGARVTAVCSGKNVKLVESLRASEVVDYEQERYIERKGQFDIIVDNVGPHRLSEVLPMLKPGGSYLTIAGSLLHILWTASRSKRGGKHTKVVLQKRNREALVHLTHLLEAGDIRSVVGTEYALEEAAEAFRVLGSKRTVGKMILRP